MELSRDAWIGIISGIVLTVGAASSAPWWWRYVHPPATHHAGLPILRPSEHPAIGQSSQIPTTRPGNVTSPASLSMRPTPASSSSTQSSTLHASPQNRVPYAQVRLTVSSPTISSELYFGQLGAVVHAAGGAFNVSSQMLTSHPDICVTTVEFHQVPGTSGAVYAIGLAGNWFGAENKPSSKIGGQSRELHQQLLVPPVPIARGTTWNATAEVKTDQVDASTASYRLRMLRSNGTSETWLVAGSKVVRCQAYQE